MTPYRLANLTQLTTEQVNAILNASGILDSYQSTRFVCITTRDNDVLKYKYNLFGDGVVGFCYIWLEHNSNGSLLLLADY